MSMAVGPNQGVKNEINVTPLVDVVLVLLIIFMVVTLMLKRGKGVALPRAHKAGAKGIQLGVEEIKETKEAKKLCRCVDGRYLPSRLYGPIRTSTSLPLS